jgi:hypothetical protein
MRTASRTSSSDGPDTWFRPCVGLLYRPPLKELREKDDDSFADSLPYEPVVVDEIGNVYAVWDYLDWTFWCGGARGYQWEHCAHFYRPHIDGPVSDAPRIRAVKPEVAQASCCPRPAPSYTGGAGHPERRTT